MLIVKVVATAIIEIVPDTVVGCVDSYAIPQRLNSDSAHILRRF